MQLDVVRNTKRNIIFGFLNKVIVLLLPFVTRTFVIRELGAEYLGMDSLFSSILHVLNLSELGFSTAIVYSMYKPVANDDLETICALLAMYRKIYKVIGLVIGGSGILLMPFLPRLIQGSYPEDVNLYLLYMIYLFNAMISYMLFAYKTSILNAFQREDIVSNINTVSKMLLYLFQIIVVALFENYYAYLIVLPCSTLLNNLLTAVVVRRRFPQYVCRGKVPYQMMQDIRVKVSGLMVSKICGASRNTFDSIFVSAFSGLAATAVYNNYFYIITAVTSVMGIVSTSLMAGIGNRVAINDPRQNFEDMNRLDFIYMVLGGWCSVCLCCLYQPFMRIWVGENYMLSDTNMILFVIYFYSLKIGDTRTLYINAAGLWWENRYRAVIETVANIVLNYTLGKYFGISGIVSATIITIIFFNFLYGSTIVFNKYFGKEHYLGYVMSHLKYASAAFGVSAVVYLLCEIYKGNLYMELGIRFIICGTVAPGLYLLIYRNTNIYRVTKEWMLCKLKIQKKRK